MSVDNAVTESVKVPNGEHIQNCAKTSILCEERTGCYCNTFDWCQTVGIGFDDRSAVDARLNTKTVNLQTMQTEETMALTDTKEPLKIHLFIGNTAFNHKCN